jgi:DNA primase
MPQGFVSFAEVKRAVSMEAVLAHYELFTSFTKKGQNLAGPCPFSRAHSARQFQVNLSKNAWYCFGCKEGGNILDFVAKREKIGVREAALRLDAWFSLGLAEVSRPAESPAETPRPEAALNLPSENGHLTFTLKTLDPNHAALALLGLRAETLTRFDAGYCTKGFLKGRLAIPIHNVRGELIAYAGLAVEEGETPRYLLPPNFYQALEVFNLHRLAEAEASGTLYLVPEIAGVLRLAEAGKTAVLGLFDGSLSSRQEEAIAGALTLYEGLILVGEGFADRTVARLARHAAVSWISDLDEDELGQAEEELSGKEES